MKLKSCCFEILSKIEIQVKLYIVHKKKLEVMLNARLIPSDVYLISKNLENLNFKFFNLKSIFFFKCIYLTKIVYYFMNTI